MNGTLVITNSSDNELIVCLNMTDDAAWSLARSIVNASYFEIRATFYQADIEQWVAWLDKGIVRRAYN